MKPLSSDPDKTDERLLGVSILLVEDNPADVWLVREALQQYGVDGKLTVITDGEEAIHFIESFNTHPADCPDLAIIDINLPKKPGFEVLKSMRRSDRGRQVPVLIFSSSDAPRDRANAVQLGANQYIRKPSRLDEFLGLGATFKDALGVLP